MRKTLGTIVVVVSLMVCAWFTWSWIDVISNNTSAYPSNHSYNFFVLISENAR